MSNMLYMMIIWTGFKLDFKSQAVCGKHKVFIDYFSSTSDIF